MNRMEQGIASIPRQTMIRDQPHMLAYITPAEAMLLKQNGGSGLPSHGGVPEFGAIGDFFGAMKDDVVNAFNYDNLSKPEQRDHYDRTQDTLRRNAEEAEYYRNDDPPRQPVQVAQPMYQAPAPVNVAPPTMTPISSGQPKIDIMDPDFPGIAVDPAPPSTVLSRPSLPQRPANKAYTFQELLGMYQNPYA
jgi:hypothetical protein